MSERPILFSAPMVRAILAGTKTQTRRIIKPQIVRLPDHPGWPAWAWKESLLGGYHFSWPENLSATEAIGEYCPYGIPGDRLWVRESHTFADTDWENWVEVHYRDDTISRRAVPLVAAEKVAQWIEDREVDGNGDNWRPSIHMPRWASRITLEVTNIRAQRLQEISEEDAAAEGMETIPVGTATWSNRQSFQVLWDRLNGNRKGCAWKDNPWAWVVDFKLYT